MKIHIFRGQNQIGGSIVTVETAAAKIGLDVGINLNEGSCVDVPPVEGLFCGRRDCSGVFISHYHADHIGLLPSVLPGIPIYIGKKAYDIFAAAADYRGDKVAFEPRFLYDGQAIQVGDIRVTPWRCDHSAYDSYMFVVEAEGKTLLYTGDFRANGRQDFSALLSRLPEVDAILIEGTTLSRDTEVHNLEEEKLEEIAKAYLKKHTGPAFVMMSAMNVDRLITAYHAAQDTGRVFLEDLYTAEVASAAQENALAPNPDKQIRVFTTGGDAQYERLQAYGPAKIGKYEIAKTPFVMCVRQSMKHYLEKLNQILPFEDGTLFYAMWKGYMEQPEMKDFIRFMEDKGVKVHILHTSGHADSFTMDQLIEKTKPKTILPIHTEKAEWFDKYRSCRVIYDRSTVEI